MLNGGCTRSTLFILDTDMQVLWQTLQTQMKCHLGDISSGSAQGAQWLSGRVCDSRPRGCEFEPHQCHCLVSLSKTHYSPTFANVR